MDVVYTGFKDKSGKEINLLDNVILNGEMYKVTVNPFNNQYVLDSELGQEYLKIVHWRCIKR